MTDWEGPARKPMKPGSPGAELVTPPGAGEPTDWEKCPVTPLGRRRGVYYFFSPSGEEREIGYRQLYKRDGLEDLFEGLVDWLFVNFGTGEGGLNVMKAGRELLKACVAAGLFDPGMQRRGPGVWRDDDKLIVHCGDQLLIDGEWFRAGFREGDCLYPLAARTVRPATKPATAAQGDEIRQAIALWNFEHPKSPEVITGFIGLSHLGAGTDWRVHCFVRAPYGSGKSWLAELVANASLARAPTNNITPAAIYQGLTGESRAIVIDEAEKSDKDERVAEVIKLIRLMSGRGGANIGRGSSEGKTHTYNITGSAFLTAILHPDLQPQDRSRFARLRLLPLETGPAAIGQQEKAIAALALARELGPALQARAVAGWPRFLDTLAIYRAAAMRDGVEPRSADSVAALLAGRDLLLRDDLPGQSEAEGDIDALDYMLVRAADRSADGEGEQCLVHLLSSHVETWGGGERKTIGEKIIEARDSGSPRNEINRILGRCGLRLYFCNIDGVVTLQQMLVARRHVGLERIFQGTKWSGAVWSQALEDLPGNGVWHHSTHFGGSPSARAITVAADHLPVDDGGWDIMEPARQDDPEPS